MSNPTASLRSDYCPICAGIGVRQLSESVSDFIGIRTRLLELLKPKLRGTWNYYGVIGNYRRMKLVYEATRRTLYKWLNRRSQRTSMTWRAFNRLWNRFQMPSPRILEKAGQRLPCQREMSFCQRLLPWPLLHPKAHARAS